MSFNNIKNKLRSERGFTIVELLIVIVVIGILAAITIVAYNGVTARANTTSAQAGTVSLLKKFEAYNADKSGYPATLSLVTAPADSGNSYYLPASQVTLSTTAISAKPGSPATYSIQTCIASAGTPIVGITVGYWDYTKGSQQVQSTGTVTGTCSYIVS